MQMLWRCEHTVGRVLSYMFPTLISVCVVCNWGVGSVLGLFGPVLNIAALLWLHCFDVAPNLQLRGCHFGSRLSEGNHFQIETGGLCD